MPDVIVYRELSSLVLDLGISAKALYSLSNNTSKHYRKTSIPKGNGEYRTLHVPDDFLKTVQSRIASVILSQQPISSYATAYRYGGSTVKNALPHVGAKEVLKLDIRHFFDNITYWQIKSLVFPEDKFSESIRVLLTMLCVHRDCLPQGAPSSPAISNIIMKDFDNAVGDWCHNHNIKYTRYCDDMTFSGATIPRELKEFVRSELRKMGFFLNDKKSVLVRQGQQMSVTGIVVNDKLAVSSRYKAEVRQSVYYCRKYGVQSHLERKGIKTSDYDYLQGLLGKVNYILSVQNNDLEMKEYAAWIKGKIKEMRN